MKMREVLHPCGPFTAFGGTVECGCGRCGRSFTTRSLTAHRETATGRAHVHCPHCGEIRLVNPGDQLRRAARRRMPDCDATPDPRTEAWYYWHPGWRRVSWSRAGEQEAHTVWIGPDGDLYVLVADGGTEVRRRPASRAEIRDYQAHQAFVKAIDELTAGRMPDRPTRDLAREAGFSIRSGEDHG